MPKLDLQVAQTTGPMVRPTADAYGAGVGRGLGAVAQGLSTAGDTASAAQRFIAREHEEKAAVAASRYELELRGLSQELETVDHNERGAIFDERASELRKQYGADFKGSAGTVFAQRSEIAAARVRLGVEKGVWEGRVRERRGALIEYVDNQVELGSAQPEGLHNQYLAEVYERLDLAKEEQLLPPDEVARLKVYARHQMTSRHESMRITAEAQGAVDRAIELRNEAKALADPELAVSDEDLLDSFNDLSPQAKPIALREFRRRVSLEDYLHKREQQDKLDETYTRILAGGGSDAIPGDLDGENQLAAERVLDWHTDRLAKGKTTEIVTDPRVYDRLMEKLARGDKSAFLAEDLGAARLKLSNGDYAFFRQAQSDLGTTGRSSDDAAYRGDVRWQAKNALAQRGTEDHLNEPTERAHFERLMRDGLETKLQQKRRVEGPTAVLTEDEVDGVVDRILTNEAIAVPGELWRFFRGDVQPRDMTPQHVEKVLADTESDFREAVYNDLASGALRADFQAGRLRLDDYRVTEEMRARLEQMGAPVE